MVQMAHLPPCESRFKNFHNIKVWKTLFFFLPKNKEKKNVQTYRRIHIALIWKTYIRVGLPLYPTLTHTMLLYHSCYCNFMLIPDFLVGKIKKFPKAGTRLKTNPCLSFLLCSISDSLLNYR